MINKNNSIIIIKLAIIIMKIVKITFEKIILLDNYRIFALFSKMPYLFPKFI